MWAKLLLLFFVFSFLFRTDLSFDQDLGRHIKLGEIIVQTHQIPKVNLFSYTNPQFPFINSHWLFEILAYFFSATGTLGLFLFLKIIIFLLSVWLIFKIIPKENSIMLLPIGFIFLHVLRERLELRPEIFSFLYTALTLYILEKFLKKKTKLIFLLPIIQLLWINTHIYFFIGLLMQTIYIIYLGYQQLRFKKSLEKLKQLVLIFVVSIVASLINPNSLTGLLYPLNVTKNYGYTIVENQTMFLLESINFRDPNFLFVKLSVVITGLSVLFSIFRRTFDVKNILLAVSGAGLALLNVRSFPYLVFLSLPAVLASFGTFKKNAVFMFLSFVTCALLLYESLLYLNGSYYKYTDSQHEVGLQFHESGKGAMDFVLNNNLPGPIYNNFDIGSYIIFRGYPKYQVFVDGRPEAYPKDFFQQIYIPTESDYTKFADLEKKLQFETIIFSHTDQTPWGKAFLQNLIKNSNWKLVYIDDFMVVFVKGDVAEQKKLAIVDLNSLSPNKFQLTNHRDYLQLGLFLLGNQDLESGKKFIEKSLQIFPDSPVANSITGNSVSQKFFW